MMRRLLALSWKELLLLARDPHGLLVLFAVPALFILIMSLALRDAFSPGHHAHIALQIVDEDRAPLAQQLASALREAPDFDVDGEDAPQARLVIGAGFSELLATRFDFAPDYLAGEAEPPLLRLEFAPTLLPQARTAVALGVRQSLLGVQSAYLLGTVLGFPRDKADALRYVNDVRKLPVEEGFLGRDASTPAPSAVQQSVPAWLIFALFFSVIPLSTAFVVERMEGSLYRLRMLDVSPGLLLASKALPYYAVNLAQMGAMLAIGVWVVPRLGGEALAIPPAYFALWLIATATSSAALGLALLVAISVRTTTQATLAGGATTLVLGALGGVMVPKLVMPPVMQRLAELTPMSWALEGFWDVLLRGGGWLDVLPHAGALFAFGAGAMLVAALFFTRAQNR